MLVVCVRCVSGKGMTRRPAVPCLTISLSQAPILKTRVICSVARGVEVQRVSASAETDAAAQ